MILDGNSRVGNAKVYNTELEMKLEKELEKERQKVEILQKGLEWYANEENWLYLKNGIYQTDKIWRLDRYGNMIPENGKHGRETLEKLKEI